MWSNAHVTRMCNTRGKITFVASGYHLPLVTTSGQETQILPLGVWTWAFSVQREGQTVCQQASCVEHDLMPCLNDDVTARLQDSTHWQSRSVAETTLKEG